MTLVCCELWEALQKVQSFVFRIFFLSKARKSDVHADLQPVTRLLLFDRKNPRSLLPRGGIMSLWQISQLCPLWLSPIPVLLEISSVIQNPISVLSSPRSCHFVLCRTKDGPRWKYKYAHRAEWAFKGGDRPQSTPHPSYAHKNSMSSSLPSVPPLLPLPDLALSSSPAFPSTIGVNHFYPLCFFP